MSLASLRGKLIASFCLLSLIVLVVFFISLQSMGALNSQFEFSAQKIAPKLLLNSELESGILALGKNEKSMLLASSHDEMNTYIDRDSALLANLNIIETEISPLVVTDQGREFMRAYLEHKAEYLTMRQAVLLLAEKQLSLYFERGSSGCLCQDHRRAKTILWTGP
jgi:CHASE3 domain sensor protein